VAASRWQDRTRSWAAAKDGENEEEAWGGEGLGGPLEGAIIGLWHEVDGREKGVSSQGLGLCLSALEVHSLTSLFFYILVYNCNKKLR